MTRHGCTTPPPVVDDPTAGLIAALTGEYLDADAERRGEISALVMALASGEVVAAYGPVFGG